LKPSEVRVTVSPNPILSFNTLLLIVISIYACLLTFLLFLFFRKVKQITHYAKETFEGHSVPAVRRERQGVFKELLANIDENANRLKDRIRLADEGKNRIFAILESMAEGVVVVDTRQKIVLINSMLGRVLEVKKKEVPGRYFWEVFRDPDINDMIGRSLAERISIRREHTLLLMERVFQIQSSPVFSGEELLGAVAVFHDVTQLKELEKVRAEFVANVSHELKTPLTSIIGFIETLKEGAIEDAENRLRFLGIIDEHSKKLHALIDDLLFLSKVESEKKALSKGPIDLGEMIENILELFHTALEMQKIKTRVKLSPVPFVIFGDRVLLERAFSNLIDNAIKYNRPGGEMIIEAFLTPGESKIKFTDTGIGIPESDVPRIFERFYRVDKSRARESGGTGLGLSIAKHIIERHSGRIEVESTLQKGSTFIITL